MAETTQPPARAEGTALRPRSVELTSEHGKTTIADTVVAKISGIAAQEVDGVRGLVPFGTGQALAGLTQRITGGDDARSQMVRVEVGVREAAVDLRLTVNYGVSIPQVAEGVRRNIINRVQAMTGLIVKEVNIDVSDLYFPEDEAKTAQVARRVD